MEVGVDGGESGLRIHFLPPISLYSLFSSSDEKKKKSFQQVFLKDADFLW